ncbi:MAG: carboxypeptidase regulatory-like domain-containing protein [Candidatus Portnoybacteria bacterium]|nr:carboxypeptidase regulatory-like domain-containing protein [Candidatus Portnoybacteria bacterium]
MGKEIPTKNLIYVLFLTLLISGFFAVFNKSALASSTDGTIDSTYKYAWGENIGWVNFGTSNGNVHVTDSALSGYALSETVGWIYLGDITNDGEGNLSGYAWSENTGWIKFNPTNGGVTINSSGEFTGSALGENIGWIIFGGDYGVKTDWRPKSVRPRGSGLPILAYNSPVSSESGFKIIINNNDVYTTSQTVVLNLQGGANVSRMAISNFADFHDAGQELFQPARSWVLTDGEGEKTVYVKFFTSWGQVSDVFSDSIIYQKEVPKEMLPPEESAEPSGKIVLPKAPGPSVVERIKEIAKPYIPEFLKPKPPEVKLPEVSIEELVSKEAPLAFQGKWQLLPSEPIREFVLAPLPKGIRNLAQKFPELEKILEEVGVSKITDVAKLKSVKLTLPGLTERVGLPTAKVEPGKFALPQGVPVAKLSPAIKQQLPTEIVFAKTGGELVDFNIALSVNDKGEPQQKIQTISGKPLQLVVKPDKPVKSVKGYVVFKSKRITKHESGIMKYESRIMNQESRTIIRDSKFMIQNLTASLFFALPSFAKEHNPVEIEERLLLLEFEYTDPDGDGIYTAEIQAPLIEGEYEIITVMDFDDPELGKKEIRLTTVVDPEGYIYERDGDKETRIPGAIVSLYWLNPETKQYEIWPAKEYQQENPQTTDVRGTYSFLVPEGYYYLKAETPGYLVYDGKPFQVKEGSGIHINIELKTKYWWLKIVDWKTILLAVVIILLLYNFYRDKIRDRIKNKEL